MSAFTLGDWLPAYHSILTAIGLEADMRGVFKQGFWSTLLVAAISLVFWTIALAHGTWPDGPNKKFFRNLQRPDAWSGASEYDRSCCGPGDIVKTKFKIEPATNAIPKIAGTLG